MHALIQLLGILPGMLLDLFLCAHALAGDGGDIIADDVFVPVLAFGTGGGFGFGDGGDCIVGLLGRKRHGLAIYRNKERNYTIKYTSMGD